MLTDEQAAYWSKRLPRTYGQKQLVYNQRKKITIKKPVLEKADNPEPAPVLEKTVKLAPHKGDLAIKKAARHYGYTPQALMQPDRRKTVVQARTLAMYVYSKVTGAGASATGRRFGKDHSTVLHAFSKIKKCPALKKLAHDTAAHVLSLKV